MRSCKEGLRQLFLLPPFVAKQKKTLDVLTQPSTNLFKHRQKGLGRANIENFFLETFKFESKDEFHVGE
jgi:hypothetical protein